MNIQRIVVIHYGEIAIKGQNRRFFEKQLIKNLKRAMPLEAYSEIRRQRGRIVIMLSPQADEGEIEASLMRVFGIANFSFGVRVANDMARIKDAGWKLISGQTFETFRVQARRSFKQFELNSVEINRELGAFIRERCNKTVDLDNADMSLHVEVTERGTFLYTRKIRGLRGLPVGVSERAVCLLSSGIDSPVASYLMLKRGVSLVYVHFHSQPFTNPASQENTRRLVEILSRFQFYARLYSVPFIDIQKEIMARAPVELRVLLYRRYMVRLAEKIAAREKARALVTGENVAQVASQTLSNIRVVGEVTPLPILRPLAGYDKEEIVTLAKKIGTFDTSIQPYEDCCSLFVPENPATKAHPRSLHHAENDLSLSSLMEDALARAEIEIVRCDRRHTAAEMQQI